MLKIAACQPRRVSSSEENTQTAIRMIDQAISEFSADLVIFPENFPVAPKPEPPDGPLTSILCNEARERNVNLIFGKIESNGSGKYKSALVVDRRGCATRCDKQLLYTDEKTDFKNSFRVNMVTIDNYEVGVLLCYDIFAPEIARYMATKMNADFLVAVTNAPMGMVGEFSPKSPKPERVEKGGLMRSIIKTRCYENSIPVVGCSMIYPEKNVYGLAMVVVPPNTVLAESKTCDQEEIIYADISPEKYQDAHRSEGSPVSNGYKLIEEGHFAPYVKDMRPEFPRGIAEYFEQLHGYKTRAQELKETLIRGELPDGAHD